MKDLKPNLGIYLLTILFWIIYCAATFLTPTPPTNPYHLTQTSTFLIQLTIVVPFLFIWLTAVYGALHLYQYAKIVKNTKDGAGFYPISWGINLIVIYLILSSLWTTFISYVRYTTSLLPLLTIIQELSFVIIYLIAFILIYKGAKQLVRTLKYNIQPKVILYGICLLILMIGYLYLLITNPTRTISQDSNVQASYFLPDVLIIILIVIPTFISWILALFSYIYLEELQTNATGILYKKALTNLVRGLLAIIAGSIITQGLTSIGTGRFLQYGLGNILILIYILLLIIVAGYIFLALGAKKLTMVEEV